MFAYPTFQSHEFIISRGQFKESSSGRWWGPLVQLHEANWWHNTSRNTRCLWHGSSSTQQLFLLIEWTQLQVGIYKVRECSRELPYSTKSSGQSSLQRELTCSCVRRTLKLSSETLKRHSRSLYISTFLSSITRTYSYILIIYFSGSFATLKSRTFRFTVQPLTSSF